MSGPKTEPAADEWMAGAPHAHREPFGDGNHPTTVLATRLLLCALCRRPRGARILDAGCGSGRLTEIAEALGAQVTAIDRDPEAAQRASERTPNARVVHGTLPRALGGLGEFDVVVANLPEPELPALTMPLFHATARTGTLIATGLMLSRSASLRRALAACGKVCASSHLGYVGFSLERAPI